MDGCASVGETHSPLAGGSTLKMNGERLSLETVEEEVEGFSVPE